ncbi:MAG: peptidylprolyl isomerase [Candidatus Micrarchaeota archaeon]|nr:peptidylprolyl isomerase [Candidatus Micrarchaeota archaeon]
MMAVEKGDLVKIEYTAYTKSGEVIDTTDAEKAKKSGIFDPKKRYGAVVVRAGHSELLEGVDEGIIGMKENEPKELEIAPEKAFGKRDEDLVRIIPLRQFKEANINPVPGQVINIDNTPATIRAVNSGRVVVDFNHPLSGVPLRYEVKVLKDAKSLDEKAQLLAEKYEMKADIKASGENVSVDLGANKFDDKRARDSAAVALVARELKEHGAKKLQFKGEWDLTGEDSKEKEDAHEHRH